MKTSTNRPTFKRYEAGMWIGLFFFSDHCIKQIDSTLPWDCSIIRAQKTIKWDKSIVTHSPEASVPLLCFYNIFTWSVICYWTDARQHGIHLLKRLHIFKMDIAKNKLLVPWSMSTQGYQKSFPLWHYASNITKGKISAWMALLDSEQLWTMKLG